MLVCPSQSTQGNYTHAPFAREGLLQVEVVSLMFRKRGCCLPPRSERIRYRLAEQKASVWRANSWRAVVFAHLRHFPSVHYLSILVSLRKRFRAVSECSMKRPFFSRQ